MRLLSLPCCLPPPSPLFSCVVLCMTALHFLSSFQLVCLSLLQKHDHIVEMYGACNSEQVRKREGRVCVCWGGEVGRVRKMGVGGGVGACYEEEEGREGGWHDTSVII